MTMAGNGLIKSIELEFLLDVARTAGMKTKEIYDKANAARADGVPENQILKEILSVGYKTDETGNASPVTIADRVSEDFIVEQLSMKYPNIPILSEERKSAPYEERRKWESFWLVDPLDGTNEFKNLIGEYSINIALVHKGATAIGVVYLPVENITYFGCEHRGSVREGKETEIDLLERRKRMHADYVIAVSRSHSDENDVKFIEEKRRIYGDKNVKLIQAGSSLKMCLVAEGIADVCVRLGVDSSGEGGTTMEWDTAAAHAVVKYAGRRVYNPSTGLELVYNKETLRNPPFIVE